MFKKLYYIVPISNLHGIFRYRKVFCRKDAERKGLIREDPSDKDVQRRRADKIIYKTREKMYTLHDYVNLYINPRNAMLYRYLREKDKIAVLEFSGDLLSKFRYVTYSFKNASADDAIITETPDLIFMNRQRIFSTSWTGDEELKKIMQSEVLVLGYVPISFLVSIITPSKYVEEVKGIVRKYELNIPVFSKSREIEDIFFENEF
ncbi:MAG: DarT ssDNA thymidine ADP-ribosyltransferase family protein [Fervidobacterium sp.]|uniref:DarT ssDNA thymidine ADP-ribosyltransferase family protein n=1 Tax=Fervidobacterium sp. TaxID=1871331 RepID=UPI00404B4AB3